MTSLSIYTYASTTIFFPRILKANIWSYLLVGLRCIGSGEGDSVYKAFDDDDGAVDIGSDATINAAWKVLTHALHSK